ncbi:MAG: glycosyltransferase family 4 protein, partial [Verrucomicrobiales bacterium]
MSGRGHEVRLVTARTDETAERLGLEVTRIGLVGVPKWARLWVFARKAAKAHRRAGEVVLGFGRTWKQDIHRAGGGCHALYSELLPWWRRWGLRNRVELALERRLYRGGETRWYVVNASPVAGQLARRYGAPESRLVVIHTAVDTERFSPGPSDGRTRHDLRAPGGPPVFLFISSNHRRKGLPGLVKALALVPDAHLWVVGAGLSARDGRLVQRAGVSDRVRAWGEVEDLVPWYREADWFIHPTLYDACANTVLQSMACGLPGLISVADGASEFVRDGENGYLLRDPGSPAGLR